MKPLLLIAALLFPSVSQAKDEAKRRVKWKDVVVVEAEPKGCEFVDKVDSMAVRWNPLRTDKGMKEGIIKGLKKKAAKLKANVAVMAMTEANAFNATGEAKVYWCDNPPPSEEKD